MDATELSLYDPITLSGVVEKMPQPEEAILLNKVPKRPWSFMTVSWDIVKGSRARGQFNAIGAESQKVSRLGRAKASAEGVAYRESKIFEPSTIEAIRAAGTLDQINAEAEILREVRDLNNRADLLAEWCLWSMLGGSLVIDTEIIQANVDYKFLPTHKPSVTTSWASATPQQLVADVRAWRKLIKKDGMVEAKDVYATENTINYVFDTFADVSLSSGTGVLGGVLMTDRMKDSYYSTGTLPGFMNLNWTPVETVWEDEAGAETNFCTENALFMVNLDQNDPWELKQLPPYDRNAPRGHRGKFSRMWVDNDPGVETHMLAWNFLPVITRPEQIVFVNDVTTP